VPHGGVFLARRRGQDKVELGEIGGREIFERVGLDEGVAAIIGLAMEIDADDVEACLLQAARCAASAAKEVERANHVSLSF
jgi:hypothetical protein